MPVGTKFTAAYVGMLVEYGVHVTVCGHLLFVFLVSQCIHSAIPTSAGFIFRNLLMET